MPTITSIGTLFGNILPSEMVAPINEALSFIGIDIEASHLSWDANGLFMSHKIHILEQLRLDLPLIPGSYLEFEQPTDAQHAGITIEIRTSPVLEITLKNLDATLCVSGGVLVRYQYVDNRWKKVFLSIQASDQGNDDDQNNNQTQAEYVPAGLQITLKLGKVSMDFSGNFDLETPTIDLNSGGYINNGSDESPNYIDIPNESPRKGYMISDTGVIIEFTENPPFKLALSPSDDQDYSEESDYADSDEESDTDETPVATNSVSTPNTITLPPDFRGIKELGLGVHYVKEGANFPSLLVENAAIGSGGFWGKIYLGTPPSTTGGDIMLSTDLTDALDRLFPSGNEPSRANQEGSSNVGEHTVYPINIAGMKAAFQYFGIGFRQSIPEWGSLRGFIFTPLINKWVSLRASIGGPNGDFMLEIGGVGNEGLVNLETDIFKITADSIAYQLKEGVNYAVVSGSIRLKVPPDMNMPEFRAQKISISEKGDVAIEGGWVRAPQQITLDLGGFKIGIREFGMGTDGDTPETKRQWIGFSGSVQLTEGIPIKGSVDGLKISWATDENLKNFKRDHPTKNEIDTVNVSLRGIGVELKIPNTLELVGSVSYHEAEPDAPANSFTGFKGHVKLNLIALKTEIEGTLMIGKSKDAAGREFTVFYIQLSASLPAAIPMGGTGTGLYGIEGLFGLNVAPTKTEVQSWYEWYVADPTRDMTGLAKWQPMNDNLAFGVGVKIGTMPDDGTTLNLGAMLVVLIPGPVIMLEGRANLLKQRSDGNAEDGAFYLLAVLDGRAGTFQLNIDVRYNLQDIVEIGGGLEAFFDFNDSSKWYIYIGRKEPVSKRLQAKILKNLFTANTYFMIDPKALQLGASVGVNINETYGPVVLRIIAGISMDAAIFFKPFQMTGELRMIADLAVTVFGIGLRLLLEALLGGKVPEPYLVYGKARVAFQLFWPLPSFNFEVEFRWEQAADTLAVEPLFKELKAAAETDPVRKAAYMKHHKSSDVNIELFYKADSTLLTEELAKIPYVPVDARPVLTFAKTLHQIGHIDQGEEPDVVGNGSFRYQLDDLILCESTDGSDWIEVKSRIDTITSNETTPPNPARFQFYRSAEICSIVNGADAKEPIIELWRTSVLDRNNSYQNEQTESPCRPTQTEIHNLNWYDEPSSQQALPAIFQHQGAWIITQQGYEPGGPAFTPEYAFSINEAGQTQEMPQNAGPVNNLPRVGTYTIPSANPKEEKTLQALRASNTTIVFQEDVIMAIVLVMFDLSEAYSDPTLVRIKAIGNDGTEIPANASGNQAPSIVSAYFISDAQIRPFRNIKIEETDSSDKAFWLINITYITQAHYQALMLSGYSLEHVAMAIFQPNTPLPPTPRTVQPTQPLILKPNKFYRLQVNTSAKNDNNRDTDYTKVDHLFFRTDAGPGVLALAPTKENDAIFKHKDNPVNKLSTYISDTFPQHGAANHYFSEKLKISFNEQYVLKLYDSSTLHLRIRDRNGKYIGPNNNGVVNTWTDASWSNGERPLLLHGLRAYLRALGRGGCGTPTPAVMEPRADFALPSEMTPNTLYFAEIAIQEGEEYKVVHDLSFTTSRYASFKQHLEDVSTKVRTIGTVSLLLSDGSLNQIQYLIENGLEGYRNNIRAYRGLFGTHPPTDYLITINQYEGVVNNRKSWEEQAATLFDNLYNNHIEKAFKFNIIAPDGSEHEVDMTQRGLPNQLEFIKIPLGASGQFLLLVESPEPIDWIHVSGTITVGGSNHSVNAVPSRDKTRALLSVGSLIYHSFEGTMSFDLDYTPFTGLGDGFDVGSATADQRRAIFTITSGISQTIQRAGMALTAGESISSPDGNYQLTLRTNGNLELMGYGITLWQSKTAGQPGARFTLQEDGNLVIYNRENLAIWSSDTWGSAFAGSALQLGDDGNLSLAHPQGQIVWETRTANGFTPKDKIQPGVTLRPNQSLYSNNRQFRLTYQADGNLVQYRNRDNQALWASGTYGQAAGRFELKADGVLAIYDPNNTMIWAARYTGDQGLGSALQLSDAGAVNVLAADGRVLQSIEHLELVSPKPENFIAFRHTVTIRNVPTATPHLTILDHPELNGNPSAILFVTPVWGNASSGVENPNVCGVWYREGRWVILNQSPSAPMLIGASFLVMATAAENPHVFVHNATAANLSMNRTYINHPAAYKRPNALLMVTQQFGDYNNREIAVSYEHSNDNWFIFNKTGPGDDSYNEALHGIPLYAKFNVLVVDGNNVPGIRAFTHRATGENIMPGGAGHISLLDQAGINNNPNAQLFFTESWTSAGGAANRSTTFLRYDNPADQQHIRDGCWALQNANNQAMEPGRMFNIFVLEEQAGLLPVQAAPDYAEGLTFVAYRHQVGTSFDPTVQSTILDHPLLNNNPAAVIFANSNWGYRGTGLDNSNLFGVRYNGSRWEIANQSGQPNTMNPAFSFNVLIAPQDCPNVFIHQATRESLQSNRSFLDHPLINGKPDVRLMVTQNLSDGKANNHEIGVAYTNGRWFVYNNVGTLGEEATHSIPEGAKFNVLVLTGSENSNLEVFAHQAAGKNIIPSGQNITFVNHPKLDHQRDAMVFTTLGWLPTGGGAYNPSMIALWYDDESDDAWKHKEGFWSIYNTFQGVPMAWGAVFNVFVIK